MILKNYIIPIAFSAILVSLFEYLIFNPRYLWWIIFTCFCVLALQVIMIGKIFEKETIKQTALYLVLPELFMLGMLLAFSFLSSELFQHFFVVMAFFLFWMMFYSLVERHKWHKEVYLFLTIVTSFVLFFALLSFLVLTGPRMFYYIAFMALCLVLFFQLFWYYKVIDRKNLILIFVGPLVLFELYWAVSFLPLSSMVATIILSTAFYLFAGLSLDFARKTLDKKSTLEYILISVGVLLATLLTTTWLPIY